MIEIQISGAGAGKTYGLAESIIRRMETRVDTHKIIHALTFTNAAKEKISHELQAHCKGMPHGVIVQTVHSYLLNELIFPFSPFVQDTPYRRASTVSLNSRYKSRDIKRLKDMNIAHVDDVYSAARRVIDKTLSTLNAAQKMKIDRVLRIVKASSEMILIDEVQDLDATALTVFEVLGLHAIDVYMVGDPKQAIMHPNALSDFLSKHEDTDTIEILPFNNTTRRVPAGILELSNRFCYPDQTQVSDSAEPGILRFIESTHPNFDEFIDECKSADALVCIEMKIGRYATSSRSPGPLHPDIEEVVRANCLDKDPDIYVEAEKLILDRRAVETSSKRAVSEFMEKHGIDYSAPVYGKLMQSIASNEEAAHVVSSIDAVKGLQARICVLIISPNTYKYLTQTGIDNSGRFNKIWKKIYVAITRAQCEFIIAFDHSLFENFDTPAEEVRAALINLGFEAIEPIKNTDKNPLLLKRADTNVN